MLKELSKQLRITTALGVLSLAAPLAASASIINFDFSTVGGGTLGGCGAFCAQLDLSGTTKVTGLDSYFNGSTPAFQFTGLLDIGFLGSQQGQWHLTDGIGDSLSGFFTAYVAPPTSPILTGTLSYGVTSGSGLFGSAWGDSVGPQSDPFGGTALALDLLSGQFTNTGSFSVESVPEPGVITLFLAGLVALGWTVRRQTRQPSAAVALITNA